MEKNIAILSVTTVKLLEYFMVQINTGFPLGPISPFSPSWPACPRCPGNPYPTGPGSPVKPIDRWKCSYECLRVIVRVMQWKFCTKTINIKPIMDANLQTLTLVSFVTFTPISTIYSISTSLTFWTNFSSYTFERYLRNSSELILCVKILLLLLLFLE